MNALFAENDPLYDVARRGLYAVVQKRIRRAQHLVVVGIVASLVAWTWGDWTIVGAIIGYHALMVVLNQIADRTLPAEGDLRFEAVRVAVNHATGIVFGTLIGWPLPMWFWLPFTAVGYHGANARHAGWMLTAICTAQGVTACVAGVPPLIPLIFGVFTLGVWNIVHRRSSIVGEIIAALEREHAALASAHTELGVIHEKLTEQIAARELAESQLVEAQKLEAIGRLAAGVAHEINTPIQYIGNNLEFIASSTSDLLALAKRCATHEEAESADLGYLSDELPTSVAMSLQGVKRVAAIVGSMKQFSHPGGEGPTMVDVNTAIHNALTLTMHEYKLVAEIETDLAPLSPILANVGELNQVLINIIVNAAHAIAEKPGGGRGTIRVRSSASDSAIEIAISDTGCGIPASIRASVFEPFFTTKPVGTGTGQGLAISRAAIERAGGELTFETEMGVGTTFLIRLPITRATTGQIRRVA